MAAPRRVGTLTAMELRAGAPRDIDRLDEIDGTIHSQAYLHVEPRRDGLAFGFAGDPRPLRQRRVDPNRLDDDTRFVYRQVVEQVDEGLVLVVEHGDVLIASIAAAPRPALGICELVDLRVDFDHRREGMGTALLLAAVNQARIDERRAFAVTSRTDNEPANRMLLKLGFELSGLDLRRRTNHDLVRESVALLWYLALDDR